MVATDDTVFIHSDSVRGDQALDRFDAAVDSGGMPRNADKYISTAETMTVMDCEFSSAMLLFQLLENPRLAIGTTCISQSAR